MGFCIKQQTVSASPEMHGPDSPAPSKTLTRRFSRPLQNAYRAPRLQERGLRFYSANLSRWVNRDPEEESGGRSLYVFVANSPCDLVDALGLATWTLTTTSVDFVPNSHANYRISVDQHIDHVPVAQQMWQIMRTEGWGINADCKLVSPTTQYYSDVITLGDMMWGLPWTFPDTQEYDAGPDWCVHVYRRYGVLGFNKWGVTRPPHPTITPIDQATYTLMANNIKEPLFLWSTELVFVNSTLCQCCLPFGPLPVVRFESLWISYGGSVGGTF